jgi:hypothetical protein
MLTLKGRHVTDTGTVVFDGSGLFDLMYSGNANIEGLTVEHSSDAELFNQFARLHNNVYRPLNIYDPSMDKPIERLEWFTPEPYRSINVREYVLSRCKTDSERIRVHEEMTMYEERDLTDLLRLMIYLVDTLRKNNIVWGVGRGSSVASYVLFLIGVHKINSLRYDLDIHEFLK